MIGFDLAVLFSVALAGVLTFFAPCTLPIIPAYVALISKRGSTDAEVNKPRAVIKNAFSFIIGFTLMFVGFGILIGYLGSFAVEFREILSRLGGFLITVFGLVMLGVINIGFLNRTYQIKLLRTVTPGNPRSCFTAGAAIALGWTPCVGPLLASVLLLSAVPGTALQGGMLLGLFSAGLALPFLLLAFLYVHTSRFLANAVLFSRVVYKVGGVMLIALGFLLLTDNFELLLRYGYTLFEYLGFSGLFKHF
jgi:cytochrome c-type biogenesis protein